MPISDTCVGSCAHGDFGTCRSWHVCRHACRSLTRVSVLEALSKSQGMSESFLVGNCIPLIFQDQSINSELSLPNRSTWCPGLLTSPPFSLAAMPERGFQSGTRWTLFAPTMFSPCSTFPSLVPNLRVTSFEVFP